MARAKIDHEMSIGTSSGQVTYPEDTEVFIDLDKPHEGTDEDGVKYVLATFPDGKIWFVPDEHLRKWIEERGGAKYWLKSKHDIEAGEIQVTIVDESGERTSIIPPRTEHL